MVKFSKELEAQLIPEWKDAFVNYWLLKKCVKKIKKKKELLAQKDDAAVKLHRCCPLFHHIITIPADRHRHRHNNSAADTIQVMKKTTKVDNGGGGESNSVEDDDEVYETQLLNLFSEQDEVKVFFEWVDEELNKVNQFYKKKETELIERGEALKKQLQILIDLNHHILLRPPIKSKPAAEDQMHQLGEEEEIMRRSDELIISGDDDEESHEIYCSGNYGLNQRPTTTTTTKSKKKKKKSSTTTTTSSDDKKITSFISKLWQDHIVRAYTTPAPPHNLILTRKKLQCADKMIRGAFIDLYRALNLLNTYTSLNMIAFIKILKKFDKVANQKTSLNYLKVVKTSHFFSSDMVVRLMDEVESIFTSHFASNDRKRAMKFLKPTQHNNNSHTVTFFVGLFTGSFVTMFGIYAILGHLAGIFSSTTTNSDTQLAYMDTVYPVFSIFALFSLHLFMYGCNLFMWKRTRINYSFIFDFSSPNTALNYRDAFLVSTTLMTTVVSAMVLHLLVRPNNPNNIDAIPGIVLLAFFVVLIFPLNILYRPTRLCFLRIMRNIVSSPFCKVVMVDFFMADQLTSQIPLLRYLESTTCYYVAGYFRSSHEDQFHQVCKTGKLYRRLAYLISFSPYYWRAMQCARRWLDEGDRDQVANMGKYVSAMVAAGARISYSTTDQAGNHQLWFWIALVTSAVATIYQLYWDFVKDWGLLNPKSTNPWLRDDLILKRKPIYYFSIALNIVLRVAWVETVMQLRIGVVESGMLDFLLASLEVIRRGHWNFYRLENEHLNNVGKFRAVKTVPLPFDDTHFDTRR